MTRTIVAILLLTSCGNLRAENTAQQLAKALKGILDDYQKEVNKKIRAEETAYEQAARLYASSQDERVFQALIADRLSLARSAAGALIDGSTSVNELLFNRVPDYAQRDFDQTKTVFAEQADGYRAFMVNLESLSLEKKKAQALSAALEQMSKKANLTDWLKELDGFRQATAKQMKFSDCALTVSRLAIFDGQKKRVEESLKTATDSQKKRLENDLADLERRITALEAERDATGLFDAAKTSCKAPA